jgi:hypothetical protein
VKLLVWHCKIGCTLDHAHLMICDCYNDRVGGPPGAEDEEGFDVGDQALGKLVAGGRAIACQICCSSQTRLQRSAGNGRDDGWEAAKLARGTPPGCGPHLSRPRNAPICVYVGSMESYMRTMKTMSVHHEYIYLCI